MSESDGTIGLSTVPVEWVSEKKEKPTPNWLNELARKHGAVLRSHLRAKQETAIAETTLNETIALALESGYEDGSIDGPNKQTRTAQEKALIASSKSVLRAQEQLQQAQKKENNVYAMLKTLEAEIGLTKAWLYSQANIG